MYAAIDNDIGSLKQGLFLFVTSGVSELDFQMVSVRFSKLELDKIEFRVVSNATIMQRGNFVHEESCGSSLKRSQKTA